jgi:hypothetical protein
MAISSYPRTIQNGQIAANGNANSGVGLMLYNSTTGLYEAATPATFAGGGGGGDATAANQTTQIANENTLNGLVATKANQTSQAAALAAATNGGVLVDAFGTQTLTASMVNLNLAIACKFVTLINLSTNVKFTYSISGGTALTLEAGYSVRINIANSGNVQIRQATGEGQTCEFIVTS